ncbi:MAG: hypothetical protein ACREBR_05150 [bacterium]
MANNDIDHEVVEQFAKAMGKCRTCDHTHLAHGPTFVNKKKGRCMDVTPTNKDYHVRCKCRLFIPKDNLEYLEWVEQCKEAKK